jgi:hypothetical protein
MSVQTYVYEAHFKWKWYRSFDAWAVQDEATVKANLTSDYETALRAMLAEKMSQTGHWYKFNNVTTTFTSYTSSWTLPLPLPMLNVDVTGESIVFFESDVKDASAHGSPQLWQIIYEGIQQLFAWLGDHPQIVVALLAVGVLTILAIWLINTTTGAILSLGSNAGALILSLGILAVAGLGIYALFFTKTGARVGRKGYQLGRRAYHRVRGR